jgi:hypothetical protein
MIFGHLSAQAEPKNPQSFSHAWEYHKIKFLAHHEHYPGKTYLRIKIRVFASLTDVVYHVVLGEIA